MEASALRVAFLLLLLVACSPSVVFDDVSFDVEIATTPDELSRGLMFRDSLPDDEGMLFVFNDSAKRTFWMKNTLIPLDIIFIDENLSVINIERALPCDSDPCPHYSSISPAQYVLEINQGLSRRFKIKEGSRMVLRD